MRSRFTEDHLAAARDRLSQYVVLGAGLDSFALRMGDALGDLTVFEVDDPPFQEWKSQRIQELGLEPPPQLRFVPCDFETTSIAEALAAAGFAADEPCFISWLGVTQYLTREAITETLRWAGERPAGSELVLTYLESNARAAELRTSMARQRHRHAVGLHHSRDDGDGRGRRVLPDRAPLARGRRGTVLPRAEPTASKPRRSSACSARRCEHHDAGCVNPVNASEGRAPRAGCRAAPGDLQHRR